MMASLMGVNEPRDEKVRKECYGLVIEDYLNTGRHRQLKLMVIGEAGQGKSTLINALIGKEVANEGDDFEAGTSSIQEYRLEQNGVQIAIWDTPGFGMESKEEDEKTVELLRSGDCYPIDLALFCFRMDGMRFPTRVHTDTIQKITEVFGKSFWQHCVFVLTFANNIEQLCPKETDLDSFFSQRVWDLEEKFRKALEKTAGLNKEELNTIFAVPVGSYKQGMFRENPWALPDREDWFLSFWMECTTHMQKSAVSVLLQVNRHRLQLPEQDTSEFMDLPPQFDACERIMIASPEEISEIDLHMNEECCNQNLTQEDIKNSFLVPQPNTLTERDGNEAPLEFKQQNFPPNMCDDEATSMPRRQSLHSRKIPLRIILRQQLDNHNSSFYEYVTEFAKQRGGSLWGIGHLAGFVEGFITWLGRKGRNS